MTDTVAYEAARKRASAKYGFLVHFAIYCAVIFMLAIINLITSSEELWFIWPMLGWGIAIVIHAVAAFLLADQSQILDRMTERELRKAGRQ